MTSTPRRPVRPRLAAGAIRCALIIIDGFAYYGAAMVGLSPTMIETTYLVTWRARASRTRVLAGAEAHLRAAAITRGEEHRR